MSSYHTSPSESPMMTPCGSPRLGGSYTSYKGSFPYSPVTESQDQGPRHVPRCGSCLALGIHSPISSGRPCQNCNTPGTQPRWTGKVQRKKRDDRQLYSNLTSGHAKSRAVTKDQVEAGSRYDQTALLGVLQNQLGCMNPDLPTKARVGHGRKKLGWKALNPNNVSNDVARPLTFNKTEILSSSLHMHEDNEAMVIDIRDEFSALEHEAESFLRAQPTHDQLFTFVAKIARAKRAERVELARTQRATEDFHVPFAYQSNGRSRL
ncbi:hypothetical protein DE146DRAFT_664559 [Phaeosphaeria sp. MPI-PUGE-AT-0046c]|nr:hypothetical protein DE146DRAFT_664559 [Phaeosphaeria sp. MPI-PUGE-AT-0046c]